MLVVDANFLMSASRFKVDATSELKMLVEGKFELVTCSAVIKELEGLSKSKGKAGPEARAALGQIKGAGVKVLHTGKKADDWILEFCEANNAVACTNDAELRKKLKEKGMRAIVLKGRSTINYA
jgi:rRNA-processing protein FCF1